MQAAAPAVRVHVHFDPKAQVFWANSPDLDWLVVEGETREQVQEEARLAAAELFALAGRAHDPELTFEDAPQAP